MIEKATEEKLKNHINYLNNVLNDMIDAVSKSDNVNNKEATEERISWNIANLQIILECLTD